MDANLDGVQFLFTTIPFVSQSDYTRRSFSNRQFLAYAILLCQTSSTVAGRAPGASIASIGIRPLRRCRPLGALPMELGSARKKVFKVELVTLGLVGVDRARFLRRGDNKRRIATLAGTPFSGRRNKNGGRRCKLSARDSGRHAWSAASGLTWRSAWTPARWSAHTFPGAVGGRRGRWRR